MCVQHLAVVSCRQHSHPPPYTCSQSVVAVYATSSSYERIDVFYELLNRGLSFTLFKSNILSFLNNVAFGLIIRFRSFIFARRTIVPDRR